MTCEEVRELLPAYVDGELHEADEVDAHLASCEACSAELADYRGMLGELATIRENGPQPAADLFARVVSLIPAPTIGGRLRISVLEHPVLYALAAAAGTAVVGTATYIAWRRSRRAGIA